MEDQRPKRVLLDKKSLGALPQGFEFFNSEVRSAYNNWLPEHSGGFFAGTPVQSGSMGLVILGGFRAATT